MNKLRLDYFLSLGLKLSEGDVYSITGEFGEDVITCDSEHLKAQNEECYSNKNRLIISFAPRKNTGKQPCGDDVPVALKYNERGCADDENGTARGCEWDLNMGCIGLWKPDLDALIKMQNEHDKKQGKAVVDVDELEQLRYACCVACNHEWKEPLGVDVNSVPCPSCGDRISKPEAVKPRVNVEYVKVDVNGENGKYWECVRDFAEGYFEFGCLMSDKRHDVLNNDDLAGFYNASNLYRKVETEIKTEKRWVGVNMKSGRLTTHHYDTCEELRERAHSVYGNKDWQIIEITVDV